MSIIYSKRASTLKSSFNCRARSLIHLANITSYKSRLTRKRTTTTNRASSRCKTTTKSRKNSFKKKRLKKKRLEVFVCKRCFIKFSSNIKLHEHIRNHHAKKSKTFIFFTFFVLFTLSTLLTLFIFFVVLNMSSKIFSKKFSTSLLTSSFTLLLTLFIILFAIRLAISKKICLTMNNFFVMFVEKKKLLDLLHRSKNSFSLSH